MARRTNTAEGGDDVMQYFFGGGRGGQQTIDPMSLALQILGMGQKEQERELSREEQEALNRYRMGGLEQSGAKTASDIKLAEAQMKALQDETTARGTEATAKRAFEQAQLGNEQFKARLDLAKQFVGDTSIPLAERQKAWAEFDPAIKNMLTVGAESANKTKAQELVPSIKAVYGKPEELKNLLAGVPEDILRRPEIPWQQMNEELGRQQAGTASGGAGAAGLLWNAPGMAQNLGKGIVNKLLSVAAGKYAPQVPYTEFTNPFEQAAGAAPATQTNLAEMIAPTINAVQPGEYAPGAGFARQQQALPVDELLKMLAPQQAGMRVP